MNTYTLPQGLLQAIVSNLNEQPAFKTRELLNAVEAECSRQDQERAQQAQLELEARAREQVLASLQPAALSDTAP